MSFNISSVVRDNAWRRPTAIALREDRREMNYRELDARARGVAAALQSKGVGRGDRVLFMFPNSIDFVLTLHGVLQAGAIPVPVNSLLAVPEIRSIADDCAPKIAVVGPAGREKIGKAFEDRSDAPPLVMVSELALDAPANFNPVADTSYEDTAVILYTSGTTGKPKGVELSHANVFWNAQLFARDLLRLTPADRVLAVLPMSHISGHTCALTAALFAGASVTLMPRFEAETVMRVIARDRITIMLGVPTMFWALLDAPTPEGLDLTSLRGCTSGGQALPEDVHRRFEARFGVEIAEGYGLTETSPNISTNLFGGSKRIRSVGQAVWGVEVRIVDEAGADVAAGERGEVIARGPGIMKGYFRNPDATASTIRDGWLYTGDIGYFDADRYLYIVDRKKELIIAGGYNIYPREIEDVLYAHPDVLEAIVIGRADEKLGEKPVAHVVARAGRNLDADELRAFCAERISRYKIPRAFVIETALPKGPTGKIDRKAMKAMGVGRK